jgi:hypothetical protein
MCDDHGNESQLSRRGFLYGSGALAAGAALRPLTSLPGRLPLASPARPAAASGASAYSMAMHIHSSFSERFGSMDSQVYQAAANTVDVLWWTDHDQRMTGLGYRDVVHFTSLDHEQGAPGQGGAWHWQPIKGGSLASGSGGGIVTNPSSPNDPVVGGSMYVHATSTSTAPAHYGFYANCKPAYDSYRDNLTGQSLSIDVLLQPGWSAGYLELVIHSSFHQASGGRPAGFYSLSYRLTPGGTKSRSAQGDEGIVVIPVKPRTPGGWTTITVTPSNDIAALWPDLDYRDFALYEMDLAAVSTGDAVSGYFDYLRFNRTISGEAFLTQQASMATALAVKYPGVVQRQSLEISLTLPHVNWYGNNVQIHNYGLMDAAQWRAYLIGTAVPDIHLAGGLASYNHPFGVSTTGVLFPPAQQDALLRQVATALLPAAGNPPVLGCDLLEVGYNARAGVDLAHHVWLWDIMSRNAIFLTGNGASDDHNGTNWYKDINNWVTSAWAASTSITDLVAALAAGRSWCGSLSGFHQPGASLDLLVDGTCPMGSVSLAKLSSRQLTVTGTKLPPGGSLQVLQGDVDYAGTAAVAPNTRVIATYSATALGGAGGSKTLTVDNTKESFVRTAVADVTGKIVGLSNPAWLLHRAPAAGVPAARAC